MTHTSFKKRPMIFVSIVGLGVLLTSFQNCGKAGFDSDTEVSLSSEAFDAANRAKYGAESAEKLKAMPFSYDATFDLISTMSCTNNQIKTAQSHLYTLKAGAFGRNAGIKVKSADAFSNYDYKNYIRDNFTPLDQQQFTLGEYRAYLADSPANNGAVPVAALRLANDLTAKVESYPFVELTEAVSEPGISESIMSTFARNIASESTNYFPYSNTTNRRFEVTMNLLADFTDSSGGRSDGIARVGDFFSKTGSGEVNLTLAFKPRGAANVSDLVSPISGGAGGRVIGSSAGVKYEFGFTPSRDFENFRNILTSVQETSLGQNSAPSLAWRCDGVQSSVRQARLPISYMIVDESDLRNREVCGFESEAELARYSDPGYAKALAYARKHLLTDQWQINPHYELSNATYSSCIYKRTTGASCYDTTSGANKRGNGEVDYTLSKLCYTPPLFGDGDIGSCQGETPVLPNPQGKPFNEYTDAEFRWAGPNVVRNGVQADACGRWQCAQFASFCVRD